MYGANESNGASLHSIRETELPDHRQPLGWALTKIDKSGLPTDDTAKVGTHCVDQSQQHQLKLILNPTLFFIEEPAAMIRRTFADTEHQALYDELRALRPDLKASRGLGVAGNAYADGYTLPNHPPVHYPEGSRPHAHWAAGVDNGHDDRQAAQADAGKVPSPCA